MNILYITWSQLKTFVNSKSLSIQYIESDKSYDLRIFESGMGYHCYLDKNIDIDNVTEFETNYKANGNKPVISNSAVQSIAPNGSKNILVNGVTKKLFARFTGLQSAVTTGSNTITYTMTYSWAKIIGIEVVGCESLDTADLKVLDSSGGVYSGVPNLLLNQFSYTLNLPKDYYLKIAQFDADVYVGMVIQITYISKSDKTIGINLLMNEVKS